MNPAPLKFLQATALLGALPRPGAVVPYVHEGNLAAQFSFGVPDDWVVQNEQELSTSGFIVPPAPLFALVASPSQAPSSVVLEASSAPWLFVTVEEVPPIEPPSQLASWCPNIWCRLSPVIPAPTVKTLVAHHFAHQGGLSVSTAVSHGRGPSAGSTSFDELAYEKNGQLWLIVAGCSASCYDSNGPRSSRS